MKLFYSTQTCSMACVSAIEELGIACEMIEVSFKQNKNVDDLNRANPLGLVPTLVLDDGAVLTQNTAILEFLADQKPGAKMMPAAGSKERAHVVAWCAFSAAELQRAFTPYFRQEEMTKNEDAQKELEAYAKKNVENYLEYIDHAVKGKTFITGNQFTVADCHLFTISGWAEWLDIDLGKYRELSSYRNRVAERPGMQRALKREE